MLEPYAAQQSVVISKETVDQSKSNVGFGYAMKKKLRAD